MRKYEVLQELQKKAFVRYNEDEKRQMLVVKIGVQMLKQFLKSRYEILIVRVCAVKAKKLRTNKL